jgi:hypothetical protein
LCARAASAQDKKPPYWASIASGEAMMRTGPGRNYPGVWLYKRRDLPVRVLKIYPNWRKIEDPDGEQGWMLVTLLSDRRTAIVKPGSPRDVRTKPAAARRCATASSRGGRADRRVQRGVVPDRDRQAARLHRARRLVRARGERNDRRLTGQARARPIDFPYIVSGT